MFLGFMNSKEREVYDKYMYELLKDKKDAFGKVSREDWRIADRIAINAVISMKKSGLL